MRKFNEQNERIKRQYLTFLKEAKGQDEASLDKVAAALLDFEEALGFKPFKTFHRDWAGRYKRHLEKRRNARTGKPLGLTTRDATLRLVKGFFHWLVSQPGFKSRISYADVDYFSNNAKDARAAHAQRPIPYPSIAQCAHAFRAMPEGDEVERRDKAIFAFLMLTGARDGAAASLRLKHIDLVEGSVFQDGREVRTKNGKTIETWFFPVDPMYRATFEAWVRLSPRGAPLWAGRCPLSQGGGRGSGSPLHPPRAVPRALRQRADDHCGRQARLCGRGPARVHPAQLPEDARDARGQALPDDGAAEGLVAEPRPRAPCHDRQRLHARVERTAGGAFAGDDCAAITELDLNWRGRGPWGGGSLPGGTARRCAGSAIVAI